MGKNNIIKIIVRVITIKQIRARQNNKKKIEPVNISSSLRRQRVEMFNFFLNLIVL
jgi:hypothetical protein